MLKRCGGIEMPQRPCGGAACPSTTAFTPSTLLTQLQRPEVNKSTCMLINKKEM